MGIGVADLALLLSYLLFHLDFTVVTFVVRKSIR